jgi:hypothetical protein
MDLWTWRRPKEGFPRGFSVQTVNISAAGEILQLDPPEIAVFFRKHPKIAEDLFCESGDKRYSPSTFFTRRGSKFAVGWFTRKSTEEVVREFDDLADAATDYLLFSRGICRWDPLLKQKPAS